MEQTEQKIEDFEKYLNAIKKFFKEQNNIIVDDDFYFTYINQDFKLVVTDYNTLSIVKANSFCGEENDYYGSLEFKEYEGEPKNNMRVFLTSDYFGWFGTLIINAENDFVKGKINIPDYLELQEMAENEFNESITDNLKEAMSESEIKFWKMGFLNGFLKDK